jgi:outer membrane receptor protein involved in Fe transport
LVALLAAANLSGQTVPAPAAAAEPDPVILSPFTVNTERDTGFVAASSLAGGRLATDLADTPAAYSVLTREFIDALNITDLAAALEWTVNTNASNDNGAIQFSQVTNLITTSRGLTVGAPQRNFFPFASSAASSVNFDSYNLDRYDFSRGPNSILFGTGALGGSANVVTKQARFDRPAYSLTTSVGSWSNYRATVDVNQPVGPRAAVRLNAVWQDSGGWRWRDFSKIKAASLTGSLKLGRATTLRAEGEYGESSRQNGVTTIADGFAGWDGKTTFSAPLTATPANANAAGISRNTTAGYYVFSPASGYAGVMNFQNSAITLGAGANAQIPIGGRLYVGATPNASGTDILNSIGLPANRFDSALAGSQFQIPSRRFSLAFDAPTYRQRYSDVSVFLNHAIGNSLFFEAALDANDSFRYAEYTQALLTNALIDINRNLPNGAPNPNFLVPYTEAPREKQERHYTFLNLRGAVAWVKNTPFGDFKFNSFFGLNKQRTIARFEQFNALLDPNPLRWPFATPIVYRYYWNAASRPLPTFSKVTVIDPVLGLNKEVPTAWEPIATQATVNSQGDLTYKYALAGMSGHFFQRKLVVLAAARYDGYKNVAQYNKAFGDYPSNWDGTTIYYKPAAPADYASLIYTPKDAQGRATGPALPAVTRPRAADGTTLPQYANDRFQDDFNVPNIENSKITYSAGGVYHIRPWVSVYANYAQTFTIPPVNLTINQTLLPATVSNGIDAGLRFNLLRDRLHLSLNRYFSQQNDQAFTGPVAGNIVNGILDANPVGDFSAFGRNIRGVAAVPPAFIQDRRDVRANGYEFEAVANFSKSLRLSANFSLARAFGTNAGNIERAYFDANKSVLRQIVSDAGGSVDANDAATVNPGIPLDQRSPDVNTAVSSWNSLIATMRGVVSGTQIIQSTTSANLFADYTLREGRLKGVRFGAGARYRGRLVIGNRAADTIVNPANPNAAIDDPNVDAYTPFYAAGSTVGTATLGYTWHVSKERTIDLNLRVDNLLNDDKPHYSSSILRPPNGDITNPARVSVGRFFWYQVPRSYNLTARVAF